jgi:MFS family permease
VLRRRAIYQALLMGAFSLFWTAIVLRLAAPPFNLSHSGIALFALAGAAGAVVAPLAGRAGDRGQGRRVTFIGHAAVILAMLLAGIAGGGSWSLAKLGIELSPALSLTLLVVTALLLDSGAVADQAIGRRAINLLRPEARGRINGLYSGVFFIGASAGALCAGPAWAWGGWSAVCWAGLAFALAAAVLHFFER